MSVWGVDWGCVQVLCGSLVITTAGCYLWLTHRIDCSGCLKQGSMFPSVNGILGLRAPQTVHKHGVALMQKAEPWHVGGSVPCWASTWAVGCFWLLANQLIIFLGCVNHGTRTLSRRQATVRLACFQ